MKDMSKTKVQLVAEISQLRETVATLQQSQTETQQALRESEWFLQNVFDNIEDGVSVFDPELNIIRVNRRYKTWFPDPEATEDRKCFQLFRGRSEPCEVCPCARALETGTPQRGEQQLTRADGVQGWLELFAFPLINEDGEITGVVEWARNISRCKLAEDERHRIEERFQKIRKVEGLGMLADGLAHDLNNLLLGVFGNAELAMMRLEPQSPAREYIERIDKLARRAAGLSDQLLVYSGQGKRSELPVDLSALLRDMEPRLRAGVSANISFDFDLLEDMPMIRGDGDQISQLIKNLVDNAAEAIGGDEGGIISVSSDVTEPGSDELISTYLDRDLPPGCYVELVVKDNGCGMDKLAQAKVFDPFFSTKTSGRGLGLAAALGMVRAHRGAIRVDSAPGQGTTVKILFPLSEESVAAAASDDNNGDPWLGGGTALVVDDEESVRSVACGWLEMLGFEVLVATDGEKAIELFRSHAEDLTLMLLDVSMPEMDGEEVLKQLRGLGSDVRVILSSGSSRSPSVSKSVAFLKKPYDLSTLRNKISEVFAT